MTININPRHILMILVAALGLGNFGLDLNTTLHQIISWQERELADYDVAVKRYDEGKTNTEPDGVDEWVVQTPLRVAAGIKAVQTSGAWGIISLIPAIIWPRQKRDDQDEVRPHGQGRPNGNYQSSKTLYRRGQRY